MDHRVGRVAFPLLGYRLVAAVRDLGGVSVVQLDIVLANQIRRGMVEVTARAKAKQCKHFLGMKGKSVSVKKACPFLQVNNWCVDIRTCKKCGKWEGTK